MDCREAERFVQLRLDEEIEPADCADLDRHLERCPACYERVSSDVRFQSELKARLRDQLLSKTAPAALRARVLGEVRREAQGARLPVGRLVAASIAAAMLGALSWSAASKPPRVYEETVERHSRNLPPEVRPVDDDAEVARFLKANLRYPVSVPRIAQRDMPVRLVGARLSNIDDRDAAYMMYDHRGAKLSLFAYPDHPGALRAADGFERRVVGGRELYVGKQRGYSVVSWKEHGLLYSLVSDVDPAELVHLAGSMR